MKGYIVNSKCYIFPQTAAEIPAVEADVFYVQEENFAAWLAANESLADKLKKYNYNVMTVKAKEWAGHTDDDLEPEPPTPTYYTITKIGDASEYISAPTQAEADEEVTVTLVDGENYTFDLTNKQKQRILFSADYILASDYYDSENDKYVYPMPSENQNIDASFKTGYSLSATIDGTPASISDLNVIMGVYDNSTQSDVTDLTDVFGGDTIQMNLAAGYTFDDSSTEAIVVTVELNGTEVTDGERDYRTFTMPSENSTLAITLTPQPHDYSQDYFTIKSLDDNTDVNFRMGTGVTGDLSYSLDNGSTWNTYLDNTITLDNDETVLFKGNLDSAGNGIGTFTAAGDYVVEGNIMSLLKGDNFVGETDLTGYAGVFKSLFSNTALTSAENLVLPATTLIDNCYYQMFQDCTSLTTAPVLPATTLIDNCYYEMFNGCSVLNYIKCLATDISANDCTTNWVYNVSASGTFVKDASMTNWTTGDDCGIPSDWTVEDEQVTPQ